jgi:hypothetical protein
MTLARPLPGVRFEAQARPLRDVLPRMDIPVFAGFAAAGPLHLPVPVEDVAELAAVFGGDVELPRPAKAREPRFAHLASAVREFFRNGGRRCWVIRVADQATAVANSFEVPGLVDAVTRTPAIAWARSEGSWSDAVRVRTNLVPVPLAFESFDGVRLRIRIATARDVAPGDLLRLTWPGSALYLFAESVTIDGRIASIAGTPQWDGSLPSPMIDPAVERLTFDLTASTDSETPVRLTGLGFAPAHPRYFGALPLDAELFADAPAGDWAELWRAAATPRFPLAAQGSSALYLPIGMTALFSKPAKPLPVPGLELERDGLKNFSAALFIDANLRTTTLRDVVNHANALRYEGGLALTGIHAALSIEEATMLSVPDAVHRGWEPDSGGGIASPPASSPLAHPELWRWMDCRQSPPSTPPAHIAGFVDCSVLDPIDAPLLTATEPDGGKYDLSWNTLADTLEELQEATQPDFSDAATIAITASGTFAFLARPSGDYFYRVRRVGGGYSAVQLYSYTATQLHSSTALQLNSSIAEQLNSCSGVARTSDWSNGVGVRVSGTSGFVAFEDNEDDDPHLIEIHQAMLRMCGARADMVALLSLPRHYDDRRAIAHTTTLTTSLEPQALSYGALWHPWLIGRDGETGPLRATPPDGATAGVMAKRAIGRGAWVAPANEPLLGVLALTPEIPLAARQALQDAAVNLIRREPAAFVCLDSDTLSADEDVRPLNVRRLLILVRRAALRTGNDYAFEPHGITLRNTVKRGFESMLASMFARGAFAGRTTQSAYQVITDETVNTPQGSDNGRFIAELRIAPSRPLSFLTVRLVQRGESAAAEEVR